MIELIVMCAPNVAPQTIEEIIRVESAGDPLAININKLEVKHRKPNNVQEAVEIATHYIEAGYSVDMGLMQINSSNLEWLGLELNSLEMLFSPCVNIAAGGALLTEAYLRAAKEFGHGQDALKAALSAYNTGNFDDGFKNGYLEKYYKR